MPARAAAAAAAAAGLAAGESDTDAQAAHAAHWQQNHKQQTEVMNQQRFPVAL